LKDRATEACFADSWDGASPLPPGAFLELSSGDPPVRCGQYLHACAGCGELVSLPKHHVVRDEQGLPHITGPAAGSVLHSRGKACGAHYFVHHGRIVWC